VTALTDEHLNAIDDALMTGASIDVSTAAAIADRYGIDSSLEAAEARQRVLERYHHPTVGPTGRRALDALLAFLQTQP
jgi:hypothetical protein